MVHDANPSGNGGSRARRLDSCQRVRGKRPIRTRFAHPDDFKLIAQTFAYPELLKLIGITRFTLKRWLAGRARIPWAAYQLAFEHSHYGLAERDAAEGFNRHCLEGLNRALTERVKWLEQLLIAQAKLVDWGCANDPFIHPADPRSYRDTAAT